jgi:hypothetical protein
LTLKIYISGIGIFGPGLDGWERSRLIFAGRSPYIPQDSSLPQPTILPPMERRRASTSIRLGTCVAQEALEQSGLTADNLATVFASSDGDNDILDQLCSVLATSEKAVSPTRFHNSVHNAPAGYWSIATHSLAASSSMSCYDFTFAGGLLDAASQAVVENRPVLLSVYDTAVPEPLYQARPRSVAFGVALVLDVQRSASVLGALAVGLSNGNGEAETRLPVAELERLRQGNPAARALPLLVAIARKQPAQVVLDYVVGNSVHIAFTP